MGEAAHAWPGVAIRREREVCAKGEKDTVIKEERCEEIGAGWEDGKAWPRKRDVEGKDQVDKVT